jgi:hypothetical protein
MKENRHLAGDEVAQPRILRFCDKHAVAASGGGGV